MDYEQKYKGALERARMWKDKSGMPKDKQGILDDIFPELKESEDERIRKECISIIDVWDKSCRLQGDYCESASACIAWLKKQKTSEEALQYLRENHSSSEMSDFQAAMNIAVAKAYDRGRADTIAEIQNHAWSEEDERTYKSILYAFKHNFPLLHEQRNFIKSLKDRYSWKPSDE